MPERSARAAAPFVPSPSSSLANIISPYSPVTGGSTPPSHHHQAQQPQGGLWRLGGGPSADPGPGRPPSSARHGEARVFTKLHAAHLCVCSNGEPCAAGGPDRAAADSASVPAPPGVSPNPAWPCALASQKPQPHSSRDCRSIKGAFGHWAGPRPRSSTAAPGAEALGPV